jgi:hypothetical protein
MKKIILSLTLVSALMVTSCGGEKAEEKAKFDMDGEVKKMCDCFQEGKNDSQKFAECGEENLKIRESLKDDNETLAEYDGKLAMCMK